MSIEGLQLGQYRLLRLIGKGGMGEVYLAEDARINQHVAIKLNRTEAMPYSEEASAKEAARLFQREAKAIAQLDHPHILPLFSYGEEEVNGALLTYIVMPFRQEGSLTDWIRRRKHSERLSLQEVVQIAKQAADALQYAHNHQIIHQDVKPSNFLLRSHDAVASIVPELLLTDFGIAKLDTATSRVSHAIRGTATYMAPEQWRGHAVPATDQYALAIMIYELLSGQAPFRGGPEQLMYQHFSVQPEPPSRYNPLLSKDVDDIILKALAKKPEDRFWSITAFAQALQQASQSADAPTFINSPQSADAPTLRSIHAAHEPAAPLSNLQLPTTMPPPTKRTGGSRSPTHRGSSPVKLTFFIGLIFLLAAASLGFFFFQTRYRATTLSATQTVHTPTVMTRNTNPYPPQRGTLVLNDPLSDNSQGHNWDVTPTRFGTCTFATGAYDVVATNSHTYHRCGAQNTHFSNFAYEVEVTIIAGSCAAVIFRGDFPGYHYYYFHICQDGSFALWLYTRNGPKTKTFIESPSARIHRGLGQINLIAVVAIQDSLTLYVNHHALYTEHDSTYSQGEIGVAVDSDTNPTEALFRQAKVWVL